jgi:hypothetical protein
MRPVAKPRSKFILRAVSCVVGLWVLAIGLIRCEASTEYLTVSEVWATADSLDGERIRLRGLGYRRFEPHHPLQVGGCSLDEEIVKASHIIAVQDLLDPDAPEFSESVSIVAPDLSCEGDVCHMSCTPFEPICSQALTCAGGRTDYDLLEFVGTLRVVDEPVLLEDEHDRRLILENIDLDASRGRLDGSWQPIPMGVFEYHFP